MGAMCGTISSIGVEEIVIVEEHTSKTSVDAKIIKILKTKKERMEGKPPPYAHFNRVILKFHQVEQAFGTLRSTYEHFKDSATDGIRYEDLKAALIYMEVNVEDNDVKEIFDESDVVEDGSLEFREFVVSLAIAYLLGIIPEFKVGGDIEEMSGRIHAISGNAGALAAAFNLIVDAYLMIDKDASGTITWDELDAELSRGNEGAFMNKERWKELDWNQDGTITFQEFLLAFSKWVGIDDDEE